jgi:hypothetical protein
MAVIQSARASKKIDVAVTLFVKQKGVFCLFKQDRK